MRVDGGRCAMIRLWLRRCIEKAHRHRDDGRCPLPLLAHDLHLGPESPRDSTDNEEPQALSTENLRCSGRHDTGIRLVKLLRGHPDPLVDDLNDDAVALAAGPHHDRGSGIGEDRRILEKFRKEVACGKGGVPHHLGVGVEFQLHAFVELNLGRRRSDDVGKRHRATHATPRVDTCEDEEGLRVTAHPGREVVEGEQPRQSLGIVLRPLHFVD